VVHFTVFRVVSVLALVLLAVWMFAGGPAPAHDVPEFVFALPPWLSGLFLLTAAVLAAVLPAGTIERVVVVFGVLALTAWWLLVETTSPESPTAIPAWLIVLLFTVAILTAALPARIIEKAIDFFLDPFSEDEKSKK